MEEILYKTYEYLGSYFIGSQKRREFYLIFFAGFTGVLAIEFLVNFTIDVETLY